MRYVELLVAMALCTSTLVFAEPVAQRTAGVAHDEPRGLLDPEHLGDR